LVVSTASAHRPCAPSPGGDQRAASASAPDVSSPSEKELLPSGACCGNSAAVKSDVGSATRVHGGREVAGRGAAKGEVLAVEAMFGSFSRSG
jgi:hypothetical protein